MAVDALDPGPDGTYPWWPRDGEGRPLNSQAAAEVAGSGTYMPHGTEVSGDRDRDGLPKRHDISPRRPDGTAIIPPTIPPKG